MLGGEPRKAALQPLPSIHCLAADGGKREAGWAFTISLTSPAQQQEIVAKGSQSGFSVNACVEAGTHCAKAFYRVIQFVITKTGRGRKDLQPHSCDSEAAGVGSNLCWSGDRVERN